MCKFVLYKFVYMMMIIIIIVVALVVDSHSKRTNCSGLFQFLGSREFIEVAEKSGEAPVNIL